MKGFRGISEERTGRTSADWYRILDEWGAREKGHTLAAHLSAGVQALPLVGAGGDDPLRVRAAAEGVGADDYSS